MFDRDPLFPRSRWTQHSPAASRAMGVLMLIIGIPCLAMAYGTRKAGVLGMLFLFGGAYVTLHGVALCIASGRGLPTLKQGLILAAALVIIGAYIWFVSLSSSIWG